MNKPLDRAYFKKKANPRAKKGPQLTECCKQDVDRNILNKNKIEYEVILSYDNGNSEFIHRVEKDGKKSV